ncbi:iron ABC transporter ATP-binding protein [Candidatus Saccharibacteria bacterium]|nr:MAG: iron ABC transporter ATP-binding protein [Candidatus Saccharibacteria bacterium]
MYALYRTLHYARNLWPYYVAITIFSTLMALTSLAIPFIIKAATDLMVNVVQGQPADYQLGLLLALALLAADVANTLFTNWGGYYGDVMSARLKKQLSERYYHHLLSLPQSYFDKELTGTIINRLNRTIFEVTNFMNMFANNFFQMILMIILTLGIVLFYSWEIALLLFIVYPLFLWLTALTSKKWQAYQDQKNHNVDIASGRFAEVIAQIKVVKSFIQETLELKHFERRYQRTVDITYKQSKQWHDMDILRRLVLNIIFFFIFGFIFWQTLARRFSIGEMFLLVQLVNMMRLPIFSMSFIVDNTQRAIAGCKDYFAVMELKPAISDKSHAPALTVSRGEITYDSVDFAYSEGDPVLHGISFTIKPGEKLALVGESGEGKTTLTNLLLRMYEPSSGTISIDGINIQSVRQHSLRQNIAVVFQDPALFSGTIRENIAYARPHASERDVIAAAKAANAHDFISRLEKGYDSQIGERGLKLSGGQKQRLAIARAILKDAPILILDEATSSLDSRAEQQVQEALDRLMQGRTTLIIAHRLSTIAHVDTIVTLKRGTIDEIGSPAKLATTNGIYAQLLQLQMGTSEDAKKKLKSFEIAS